ncbi:MAG: DUF3299 domain-containing protein [Pirellulales bacterium]
MSVAIQMSSDNDSHDYSQYRSLSFLAISASIWGVLSLSAFLFVPLLSIAVVGVLVAALAMRNVRRHADEVSGMGLARAGMALSLVSLIGGGLLHSYVYATEVPDGYQRISFVELQPDPMHPQLPIPPAAKSLDGQRIFVAGYVYPDGQKSGIKRFVLVPDMGTCCFGGQPKLTDMIEVTLKDPLRTSYSLQRRRVTGVLKVDESKKPVNGLDGVYYQLEADRIF